MQILACPDHSCQAPAEIEDRWVFPSTSGPVEHVQTRCLNGHVFTPTTWWYERCAGGRLGPPTVRPPARGTGALRLWWSATVGHAAADPLGTVTP